MIGLAALLGGCAQAVPRFPPDVQAAIVDANMQRLETPDMRLYYPARDREEALRVAARFEACIGAVRERAGVKAPGLRDKANVVLPPLPLNNAYVQPGVSGMEPVSVVPTFATDEMFAMLNIPPDPSAIGCHEMVHYVHARQLTGLPRAAEAIFGYLVPPEEALEPWFWEGIAVYYETRLQAGIGRLRSALWTGTFAAGVAAYGLRESDVNESTRRVPYGPQYLVGSHFIDWLVRKFGEEKLWDVIARQSDELVIPFGVSGRFRNAYGAPLARLYADFAKDSETAIARRERPPVQHRLRALDQYARLAVAPDGTWATVEQGLDTQPRLVIVGPDGTERVRRNLTDLVPVRELVAPTALGTSGLSFTADSSQLWFVALDTGRTRQVSRLVRVDVATGALRIVEQDLGGAGGSISADGSAYWFSQVRGDSWELAAYDVRAGTVRRVASYGPRVYVVQPRVSPDGRRVAATFATDEGLEARVLDARTGAVLARVPAPDGPTTEPWWVDDDTLVVLGEADGRLQVFRASLAQRRFTRVTDAPHVAFSPAVAGGRVLFLNREGWTWTVDEAPLPAEGDAVAASPSAGLAPRDAVVQATPARDAPVDVVSDAPYWATDHLFVPTLRGPAFTLSGVGVGLGLGATGGDRLGFHRWGLAATWDFVAQEPSFVVSYINGQLAPVFVSADFEHDAFAENYAVRIDGKNLTVRGTSRETLASLLASRTFWTTTVTSGLRYDEVDDVLPFDARHRRAPGALLALAYSAVESTPAAGPRRALDLTAAGTFFPALSGPAFGDVRLSARVVTPLPFSRRHTLSIALVGRALPGLSPDEPLLQVGGGLARTTLRPSTSIDQLPPALHFQESVRGFEDFSLLGTRTAKAEVLYRLPIISDRGSISTIYFLPSFLFRQIDLEAFGSGATLLDGTPPLVAAGGAVIARFKLWLAPIDLGLQVARRLTYDEGVSVTFVGTGVP